MLRKTKKKQISPAVMVVGALRWEAAPLNYRAY